MKKQKLTIFVLIAILAVAVPLAVEGGRTTWIGVDCGALQAGDFPTCNNINDIESRLYIIEHDNYSVNLEFAIEEDDSITMHMSVIGMYYLKDDIITWIINNSTGAYASGENTLTSNSFSKAFSNVTSGTYNAATSWDGSMKTTNTFNIP